MGLVEQIGVLLQFRRDIHDNHVRMNVRSEDRKALILWGLVVYESRWY